MSWSGWSLPAVGRAMDRELVLAVLVVVCCGSALALAGWWPAGSSAAPSGRARERRTWQRLWLPFWPAALVLAALCGWALVEPARAERVPACLLWGAAPFAIVLLRAVWRALWSLQPSHHDVPMATVGLLRPRIVLSPRMAAGLDERTLAAALEHEQGHVRHRDPLRLWLGQLASDVLWPWPAAAARFLRWRRALELARDEEARLRGAAGADLAAAVLAALRFSNGAVSGNAAALGGDQSVVAERIAYLMRPLEAAGPDTSGSRWWWLAAAFGVGTAVLLGSEFGERVVRALFAVL